MGKLKLTKERIAISLVILLSAILNFANLAIEGYANEYYASGVKSMMMNFKNFFFVSFDPAGFVSIDKPPLGFWIQTISAKIFGFSGMSILLPQALAGVISVGLIYYMVKRSFGFSSGIISALCLCVTPVFVAASRNNTVDNLLVVFLLISCMFLSKAAEQGKLKYLIISLVLVGLGFNIKMLEAYMVGPAIYITYLISAALPLKKRIIHLAVGTLVLLVISLSWAFAVDLVPSKYRPFVGSSTNNTVMELIFGHNGLERLSSSSGGMGTGGAPGNGSKKSGNNQMKPPEMNSTNSSQSGANSSQSGKQNASPSMSNPQGNSGEKPNFGGGQNKSGKNFKGKSGMPSGGPGGGMSGLSGSFGGQTEAGVARLFSKNVLSDQIVWFIPLAFIGFIAAALVEKLKGSFNNKKKLDLILWFLWFFPEFIYFSYTKGLFHPYYLTMMAPPAAALSGIGITSMWKLYKQGGIKSFILPVSFIIEGIVHLVMLSYFASSISASIKAVIIAAIILCFGASALLILFSFIKNKSLNTAKILTAVSLVGILTTPAIGASATITHSVNGSIPAGGLELLSNSDNSKHGPGGTGGGKMGAENANSTLISFLEKNASNSKYALVVSSSNTAGSIILESGQSVMALGGFSGSDKILTLSQFKELVKKGEVRYVLSGGMDGRDSSQIMSWIQKNGKKVSEDLWNNTSSKKNQTNKDSKDSGFGGMDNMRSQTLYDLKGTVK